MADSPTGGRAPLPPTFPDLRSLELFASVCRLGSLSAAAAAHGITQPSASARIRGLERQVGVSLLQRGSTGSKPTPNGELVAEWAETFLDGADDLYAALSSLSRSPTSPVTIAASYTIAEFLLPGWLAVWRRGNGRRVELEVVNSTGVITRVERGEVELGFVESTGPVGSLEAIEVGRDELVCVVAGGHPLAERHGPLGPEDLATVDLVSREAGSGTREAFTDALRAAGVEPPRPTLEMGSTAAVRGAVIGCAGLAVLSRLTVAADLSSGSLIEVPTTGLDLGRPLRAVWKPGRLSAGGRALIEVAQV